MNIALHLLINFLPSIVSGPIIKEIIESRISYIFERILNILQLQFYVLEILHSSLIFIYGLNIKFIFFY